MDVRRSLDRRVGGASWHRRALGVLLAAYLHPLAACTAHDAGVAIPAAPPTVAWEIRAKGVVVAVFERWEQADAVISRMRYAEVAGAAHRPVTTLLDVRRAPDGALIGAHFVRSISSTERAAWRADCAALIRSAARTGSPDGQGCMISLDEEVEGALRDRIRTPVLDPGQRRWVEARRVGRWDHGSNVYVLWSSPSGPAFGWIRDGSLRLRVWSSGLVAVPRSRDEAVRSGPPDGGRTFVGPEPTAAEATSSRGIWRVRGPVYVDGLRSGEGASWEVRSESRTPHGLPEVEVVVFRDPPFPVDEAPACDALALPRAASVADVVRAAMTRARRDAGVDSARFGGDVQGDCTRVSHALVDVLGACSVRAEVVWGVVWDGRGWAGHAWVRVYWAGRGYSVDPTWGVMPVPTTHVPLAVVAHQMPAWVEVERVTPPGR
jgi:hypothetical protein